MRKLFFCFLVLLFALAVGCSTNRTVIKDQDITVKVPEVKASLDGEIGSVTPELRASIEDFFSTLPESTFISGSKTIIDSAGHIQTAQVKFYPNRKKGTAGKPVPEFVLDVRQSDIHIRDTDTTSISPPSSESLWDKVGSAAALGVFLILIVMGGVIFFKFSHSFSK